MKSSTYKAEANIEETHWWFVGRRKFFSKEISTLSLSPKSRILDVGTSTGTNLRMLRELGYADYVGLDFSDDAIRFCREKGLGEVIKGDIKELPFPDATFDLVLATDIIEHIDDDEKAMSEISRVLRTDGHVLVTVPAFMSLWGLQDDVSHHQRRYRLRQLSDLISSSGLKVEKTHYFNFLLFIPIWAARRIIRVCKPKLESENQLNSPTINRILKTVFAIDLQLASFVKPPFGVSILALAKKGISRR